MAEDKDKIVETPEIPEVENMEEGAADIAPEVTEETLVVAETESPEDTPVEVIEATTEEKTEVPFSEINDDFISEKEVTEEPKVSQHNYAD